MNLTAISNWFTGTKGYIPYWHLSYIDGIWYVSKSTVKNASPESAGTSCVHVFVDNTGILRFSMDNVLKFVTSLNAPHIDMLEALSELQIESIERTQPEKFLTIVPYSDTLDLSQFDKKRLHQ